MRTLFSTGVFRTTTSSRRAVAEPRGQIEATGSRRRAIGASLSSQAELERVRAGELRNHELKRLNVRFCGTSRTRSVSTRPVGNDFARSMRGSVSGSTSGCPMVNHGM